MAQPTFASRWLRLAPFDPSEDADAAPGAMKGPCAARPWTFRRAWQNLAWVYAFGLVFLIFPLFDLTDSASRSEQVVGAILIALIASAYLGASLMADASLPVRWGYVAGFVALQFAGFGVWGWDFAYFGVYAAILMATLLPWRQARLAIPGWAGVLLVDALISRDWTPAYIALIAMGIALGTGMAMESGRVSYRLSRAEQRVSVLSVAAERERIGRDLHDILGHSLTAISIKSTLAARLVDQDPAAAKAQLAEIAEVSRRALTDVRSTASGFREVRVAIEVASARSVLLAAGIAAVAPSAVTPLSDEWSELFGYVVREGVTNVVRHSEATTCTIVVEPDRVTVSDDGLGSKTDGRGSGLTGLTARVQSAGGRLEVESQPGRGTVIRAIMTPVDVSSTPSPTLVAQA